MHLTPLYEKIVVEMDTKQEVKSTTGLVYTKNLSVSAETTVSAKVVAVGEGRLLANGEIVPMKVKVGDRIVFSKMQGESYSDGIHDYTILSESAVLLIIKEDTDESN